ncbi:transcription termination factor 4, mitochondrial [Culicoides brevitarsis]|uniref:transcription termination factor 4, mitochondrial n=1 Tax=Culicoides brevitarsis TaxID=469753 RepID=UPI00307CBF0A
MFRRTFVRFYCVASNKANILKTLKEHSPKINIETISSALDQFPNLTNFQPLQWEKTFSFLINQQNFPHESCINIVSAYPQIFTTSLDTTFKQLEAWRGCQFGEKRLQDLICKHPALIQHGNEKQLSRRMAFLQGYVQTPKNVWRIMMSSPEVAIQSEETLAAKFKYLIETMQVEVSEIVDSDVFLHDLEHIKMRHIFMQRLGLYKVKSKRADVRKSEKNSNPRLNRIVDTSDKKFATKICYVTLEEYEVFQELLRREWERQDLDDEDEDFDELQKERGIDIM